MRSLRYLTCGAFMTASLATASSASAANWDPSGVEVTATSTNTSFTFGTSTATVHCNTVDMLTTGVNDVRVTTAVANPVAFGGGCSTPLGANTGTVTTYGTWFFTAVSTTSANLLVTGTGPGGTGPIVDINIGGICTVTIDGPVSLPAGTWNNTTHQLTINSLPTFTNTSGGGCFGLVSSPGTLEGTFTFPASAIIT